MPYTKKNNDRRRIDITGKRFGRLIAVAHIPPDGRRAGLWRCYCDCGKLHVTEGASLRHGKTRSCGCLLKESSSKLMRAMKGRTFKRAPYPMKDAHFDMTGRRFGRLTAVEYAGSNEQGALWKCVCTCGTTTVKRGASLRNGGTRSCGCLRRESAVATLRKKRSSNQKEA